MGLTLETVHSKLLLYGFDYTSMLHTSWCHLGKSRLVTFMNSPCGYSADLVSFMSNPDRVTAAPKCLDDIHCKNDAHKSILYIINDLPKLTRPSDYITFTKCKFKRQSSTFIRRQRRLTKCEMSLINHILDSMS